MGQIRTKNVPEGDLFCRVWTVLTSETYPSGSQKDRTPGKILIDLHWYRVQCAQVLRAHVNVRPALTPLEQKLQQEVGKYNQELYTAYLSGGTSRRTPFWKYETYRSHPSLARKLETAEVKKQVESQHENRMAGPPVGFRSMTGEQSSCWRQNCCRREESPVTPGDRAPIHTDKIRARKRKTGGT